MNIHSANAFPRCRVLKAFTEAIFFHNEITVVELTIFRHGAGMINTGEADTCSRWQRALSSWGNLAAVSAVSHSPLTNMTHDSPLIGHWKPMIKLSWEQIQQHLLMAINDKPCVYVCVDLRIKNVCIFSVFFFSNWISPFMYTLRAA